MRDDVFRSMLVHEAQIGRARVELDIDGAPLTPVFDPVLSDLQCRVTPARQVSDDDLLGRSAEATHWLYCEPVDLRVGDRVWLRPVQTLLTEAVEAGHAMLCVDDTSGLRVGGAVEVGSGGEAEERIVASVGVDLIVVTPAVSEEHEAGETVSVLRTYEVLTVDDEAGLGHHLKAAIREIA